MATSAVATRQDQGAVLIAMVDKRAEQFRMLLGGDERQYERFRTVAIHAITSDPKVLAADPASIIEAVRDSATLGLEPNGLLGEGHVIAYGKHAQFQPGYRGLLKLARRSREVASIDAQCVYASDEFSMDLGTEARIVHRPSLGERGNRIGVYGYARLSSGELVIEWMPNADIEMVRRSSKQGNSGPWVDWPDEMARKTVIKRLCKRLPLDHLAERALELEARADSLAIEPARPTRASGQTPPAMARVHERLGITSGDGDWAAVSGQEAGARKEGDVTQQASAPADAGVRTDTSSKGPSDPDAGKPMPAPIPAAVAAEDDERCYEFDKEHGRCHRDAGHDGHHADANGETW